VGLRPSEAETLFAFERSLEAINSPFFLKFAGKRQKNAPFHIKSPVKNFHGRAKGGHRTMPPLNTPLLIITVEELLASYDDQIFYKATYDNHCLHHLLTVATTTIFIWKSNQAARKGTGPSKLATHKSNKENAIYAQEKTYKTEIF